MRVGVIHARGRLTTGGHHARAELGQKGGAVVNFSKSRGLKIGAKRLLWYDNRSQGGSDNRKNRKIVNFLSLKESVPVHVYDFKS